MEINYENSPQNVFPHTALLSEIVSFAQLTYCFIQESIALMKLL
jgi:hypothetical protein